MRVPRSSVYSCDPRGRLLRQEDAYACGPGGIHAGVLAGVIFDCDGVLVDTEPVANRVLAELLTEQGLPTTTEQSMERYMGRSMASSIAISEELLGTPLP